jgi:hypothetical protein
MEDKRPVYRDPGGNEINPVNFVADLWMNNTLPGIALDALAQFILLNAMENLGLSDSKFVRRPLDLAAGPVVMRQEYVKDIETGYLMDPDYWYDGIKTADGSYTYTVSMIDNDIFRKLYEPLAGGRVVERSIRASIATDLDINALPESPVMRLYLAWLETKD